MELDWTGDLPQDEHFRLVFFPQTRPIQNDIQEALEPKRGFAWQRRRVFGPNPTEVVVHASIGEVLPAMVASALA